MLTKSTEMHDEIKPETNKNKHNLKVPISIGVMHKFLTQFDQVKIRKYFALNYNAKVYIINI